VHLARDIAGSAMPETPSQPETEVLCLMGSTVLIASRAMHEVLRLTRKAARSDAAVILYVVSVVL